MQLFCSMRTLILIQGCADHIYVIIILLLAWMAMSFYTTNVQFDYHDISSMCVVLENVQCHFINISNMQINYLFTDWMQNKYFEKLLLRKYLQFMNAAFKFPYQLEYTKLGIFGCRRARYNYCTFQKPLKTLLVNIINIIFVKNMDIVWEKWRQNSCHFTFDATTFKVLLLSECI